MIDSAAALDRLGVTLRSVNGSLPELPAVFRDLLRQINAPGVDHESAFGEQLAALVPRLSSYARSLARDADTADDLVQETMLKAWAARRQFRAGTNLRAWVYTILRNLFRSSHRRDRFIGEYDELVAEHRLASDGNQLATLKLAEVMQAIGQLSSDQAEALTLVAINGLSYEEAAARTDSPIGTLKSRVARARAAIEAMLDGDQPLLGQLSVRANEPDPASAPRQDKRGEWAAAKASGRSLWIG